MRLKRFIVFGFNDHYPAGGLSDIVSAHDTLEEAQNYVSMKRTVDPGDERDNYQIFDTFTLQYWGY